MNHRFPTLLICLALLSACSLPGSTSQPAPVTVVPPAPSSAAATVQPTVPTVANPTDSPAPTGTPAAAPTEMPMPSVTPATSADPNALTITLEPLVSGLTKPLYLTHAGDGSGRLFVVEQAGVIKIIRDGAILATPFLDITERVGSGGNEQGLLSIAFHPRYSENGQIFLNYTDKAGDTQIVRMQASGDQADIASAVTLLAIPQPYQNHNGGLMKFGPDGYLYIGMGDGGSGGDPENRAQNTEELLGKLLRIDVDAGDPYGIPADNPYVNGGGRPEIWALGLRNPWRFSFDRATGDLFIGDVGQNKYEEVDYQPAGVGGVNYGWKPLEGSHCYVDGCDAAAYTPPIIEYPHEQGCSVTGGYVYNGKQFPALKGVYLFGDYCTGTIWALTRAGDSWQNSVALASDTSITSFGEDQQGELYLVDRDGVIYRIVPTGV